MEVVFGEPGSDAAVSTSPPLAGSLVPRPALSDLMAINVSLQHSYVTTARRTPTVTAATTTATYANEQEKVRIAVQFPDGTVKYMRISRKN